MKMKYAIIPILALLLIGGVSALAQPDEEHAVCNDCEEVPEQEIEPVVVMVDEPRKSDSNERALDECNFDVERPRCFFNVWDDDITLTANGKEFPFNYDYRRSKYSMNIDHITYNLYKHGAFIEGDFVIEGKHLRYINSGGYKARIVEVKGEYY